MCGTSVGEFEIREEVKSESSCVERLSVSRI